MPVQVAIAPRATYRLQMHKQFGFAAAAAIADYLEALGVSHVYSSPYLQAGSGSTHGYDVLDHGRVNEELGGAPAHERFCRTLGAHHLGQVLDIVPNHMSIAQRENKWWWDVLENGPSSRYANYFDVDWQSPDAKMRDAVLLPILGGQYGRVLEAGEIQLQREGGTFTFRYHDHLAPVAPPSLNDLLSSAAARCESDTLAFIAESFGRLPSSSAKDQISVSRRHRDKEVLRTQLTRLCNDEPAVAVAIDKVVSKINASPDDLDTLLQRQNYRLAFWRAAGQDLDYRRFFDINTLISLRMEDARVFADTHAYVLRWLAEGVIDGLRVDHPDGLRDPEEYFARLHQAAPQAWIVAEKILESGETLPETWSLGGTTGYDFLNRVGGLLIDPRGEAPLTTFYAEFTGESCDLPALVRDKKRLVLKELFGSDINRLVALLATVCERHRCYRDYTRRDLHAAVRELIACFPVYRTYVQPSVGRVSNEDVRYVGEAVEAAKSNRPDLDVELFHFLRDLLLLQVRGEAESEFVVRFQQATGPVMAKGVEDTTFYNFNRLLALNEVGGDPGRFGISLDQFHADCVAAQTTWPQSMLASTTHDTKRSEDVRARLALLSEIPERWQGAVTRWSKLNARHRPANELLDRNMEYLIYQTLVGAWPLDEERLTAYLIKAAREAKAHTSWTDPRQEYEEALTTFAKSILSDEGFLSDLLAFVSSLVEPGRINSLAQTLIKLTAPGVPDIYQGTELWNLSLVDPDNRREVDYVLRHRLLKEMAELPLTEIVRRGDEGLPKLWTIHQALALRERCSDAFGVSGDYAPMLAKGTYADHVVAYARGTAVVVVVPRLLLSVSDGWSNTALNLPPGSWRNVLTSQNLSAGRVLVRKLFAEFPVALLERTDKQ